jgi:hypothetical protein
VPEASNGDEVRFQELYYEINQNINSISDLVNHVLTSKAPLEFLVPFLAYLAWNMKIYFLLLSVIYGVIFINVIRIFRTKLESFSSNADLNKSAYGYWFYLIYISNFYPFWNSINGFRFASVSMLFFILVVTNMKNSIRWLMMISLLIFHNSAAILIIFYGGITIFQLDKLNKNIFFGLYFLSLLYLILDLKVLSSYLPDLVGIFGNEENNTVKALQGYTDSDFLSEKSAEIQSLNWNVRLNNFLSSTMRFLMVLFFYLGFRGKDLPKLSIFNTRLFYLSICLFSFTNFLSGEVGSIERFYGPAFMIMSFLFFSYSDNQRLVLLKFFIFLIVFIQFVLQFRVGFDLIGINLFQPLVFGAFNDVSMRLVEIWEAYGGFNN